ncbi:purine catabolism regulator [Ornithinimicrobium humiphilum]|uniref:Purine catabolism regulator n=1 Tax=Ornithinimicrobium humiphilum TaxID=125288 RepID=A0A543KMZ7_9MICO|nr:PucR family transcriptional regulator [Ornithinimicrobium humiphilum]TQM96450.1 purine catabolism regulator [Ornithinimicrobium humiphilum]
MLTLAEFLAHECVRRAEPELLGRDEHREREVQWVHSSEIYEIAPLLSGGEVLLTTGLGLAGADAGSRRHWVRDVAARGVAAVALEPGRSLPEVPPEIVDEARRADLPLVVLRAVVPFAEICRQVNSDLLSAELARLRRSDELVRQLHDEAADGAGVEEVVVRIARSVGAPVEVSTLSGQVVAAAAPPDGPARRPDDHPARSVVRVAGAPWGHVLVGARSSPETQFYADRVAAVVGLVVERSVPEGVGAGRAGVALLGDLLERGTATTPDRTSLLARMASCGFHPAPHHAVVGVAGACADPRRSAMLLARAEGLGPHLVDAVRGQVLGLVAVAAAGDPAGRVADLLDGTARDTGTELVVGPPVGLPLAGRTLQRARAGLAVGPGVPGAASWRRSTVPHLLGAVPPDQLDTFLDDALGALRRWDREHGTELVRTLDVWIEHGLNISAAARALLVRRQTVHERLARIRDTLGYDPADGRELGHLVAAVAAARVRRPGSDGA